jgi:hypothetical protein
MSAQQELRDWQDVATGDMADALRALLRSDRSRLAFWEGPALPNPQIEAQDRPDDAVGAAVAAASADPLARVCIGWIDTPEGFAAHGWIVTPDGIADPARERLGATGYLGVELRSFELARWTPTGSLVDLGAAPHERNYVP